MDSSVSESARSPLGIGEFFDGDQFGLFVAGDDHLRDAFSIVDDEVGIAQVDEYDAYLATVVGIDGAG